MESLSIPESVYPKKQDYELPKMIIHSPVCRYQLNTIGKYPTLSTY